MSRKNGHVSSQLPVASDQSSVRTVNVEMTEDEVRLLINVIQATPVQGNLQSLPPMMARLKALQEKLVKAISDQQSAVSSQLGV